MTIFSYKLKTCLWKVINHKSHKTYDLISVSDLSKIEDTHWDEDSVNQYRTEFYAMVSFQSQTPYMDYNYGGNQK